MSIHVAILQPALRWGQTMANMMLLRKTVEALPASVDLIVLPEGWQGLPAEEASDGAEHDKAMQFLSTLARVRQATLVGGTVHRRADGGRFENVCYVLGPDGERQDEYVKQRLFAGEQDTHQAGAATSVFEINGVRVSVLICADVWHAPTVADLRGRIDVLCVPIKTGVPSDRHVDYARALWHGLALTRAMENGFATAVSDWSSARHALRDIDVSVGSVHAPGMTYSLGRLQGKRHDSAPVSSTAIAHTSAAPALGDGVHYTCGASTLCDPGQRPDLEAVRVTIERGVEGVVRTTIDAEMVREYYDYRTRVGLLTPPVAHT